MTINIPPGTMGTINDLNGTTGGIGVVTTTPVVTYNFCPNCGRKIETSWNFCGQCGQSCKPWLVWPWVPWIAPDSFYWRGLPNTIIGNLDDRRILRDASPYLQNGGLAQ